MVDYTAVDDIGNVINHVLADGQLHGGVMQGAGQAFGENCLYDEDNGQLVAGSFMDYVMPRADLIRKIRRSTRWCRRPATRSAPRAPARPGTTGAAPACMNAVVNALRAVGRRSFRHAGDAGADLGGDAARRRAARLVQRLHRADVCRSDRATVALSPTAPSPLVGEGSMVSPRILMGEGASS